jgi:Leucine-rich repeat (LRR) protein
LNNNNIKTLPSEIDKLINLQSLYLIHNNFTTISNEICSLINLKILILNNNNLTTIPTEIGNLINLQLLHLNNNNLTTIPVEIGNLINLQILDLINNNNLTTIPAELGNLINLQRLYLYNNNLTTIPAEIGNLINLHTLYLKNNKLIKIPAEIGNLINLQTLNLSINNLTTIPSEIGNLINLQQLYLYNNKLTTIPNEIGNLINLRELCLDNNNLTTIPIEIINIRYISIYCNNNPIEYIPPQVIRHLERNKTIQKIYNDNQSVHNHAIQEGIKKSINYIMSIKPIYKLDNLNDIIINNTFINNDTKTILFEYINCQDIHSILNITFAELLINVLSFINQHEAKDEIYKVLEQEMNDTICKCFTGRMSRLINCLNGFDDHIVINISDTEQIGNIIILVKDKLIKENNYTIELHKEIVIKELYDRGYDKDIIDEWIDYI